MCPRRSPFKRGSRHKGEHISRTGRKGTAEGHRARTTNAVSPTGACLLPLHHHAAAPAAARVSAANALSRPGLGQAATDADGRGR